MAFKTNEIKVVLGKSVTQGGITLGALFGGQEVAERIGKAREDEVAGLASILEQEGVQTVRPNVDLWVRDQYIFRNDLFFPTQQCGNWAVGGAMLFADDYMLVPVTLPNAVGKTETETRDKLCEVYGVSRVYFMPTHEKKDHLDLYLLLLPDINVVISDSIYYARNKLAVDELARAENLRSLQVPNAQITVPSDPTDPTDLQLQANTYPTNSIDLVDSSGKLLVFTAKPDGKSPLVEALADYNVRVIEVPFARQCLSNGSIRCKTNFFPLDY